MKTKNLLISLVLAITLVVGIGLALGGCKTASTNLNTNLKKPASSYSQEEAVIKRIIDQSSDAWNRKDVKGYMSFFDDNAQIMVGRERRIVNKADYEKMLPAVLKRVGEVKHNSVGLEIDDQGQTAEVDMVVSNTGKTGDIIWITKKLRLIKRDDKWLITKSTFNVYFRGDTDPRERRKGPIPGEKLDES